MNNNNFSQYSSGNLNPLDLYTLHEYLVAHVFKHSLAESSQNLTTTELFANGAFVTPPDVYSSEEQSVDSSSLTVFLKSNSNAKRLKPFNLLIYRCINTSLCLFIKGE